MELVKKVEFENIGLNAPEILFLTLTDITVNRVKPLMELVKLHSLSYIEILAPESVQWEDDSFRTDNVYLHIFAGGFIVYAASDYNSGDFIESEMINLNEIVN